MEKTYNTQEALSPSDATAAEGTGGVPEDTGGVMAPKEAVVKGDKGQDMMSRADQAYISGLMKLLHSKETAPSVEEMLQSGPPEKTIPVIALQINDQMEQAVEKKPSLETALAAGTYLVQDLIEIGNAAGFFQIETEEQIKPILQGTIQQYIEKGLKEGTIDPVELQEKVEPLMDDDQRATGMQAAELTGIPKGPTQDTAMAAYGRKMEQKGMMKGNGGAK